MENVPADLKYSKDHEWARIDGDIATIGITDHAQKQLGDVVYVEVPKVGDRLEAGETFGSVESVKAVSEIYLPVGGEITAVNETLDDEPETVNTDPYGDGWLVKVRFTGTTDDLLTAAEYEDFVKEEPAD
jgi:glycine cleavage system H protein